jgi:hypothetical protein
MVSHVINERVLLPHDTLYFRRSGRGTGEFALGLRRAVEHWSSRLA